MNDESRQELLASVNALITSPDAHSIFDAVNALSPVVAAHPITLTSFELIRPLLLLRQRDKEATTRVLDLIEQRRLALGYDELRPAVPGGYDKVSYMREFMDRKRERQRTAVEIENMLRPERDKLVGNARLEFMNRQSARWKVLRDAFLDRVKAANGDKRLSKEQVQQALDQFWSAVDDELEAKRKAAQEELLKPAAQRRPNDISLTNLVEALQFDPYKK